MNKKQFLLFLLPCLVFISVALVLLLFPDGETEGHYHITGRYVKTADGQHMIYRNTDTGEGRYVLLLPRDNDACLTNLKPAMPYSFIPRPAGRKLPPACMSLPKKVWDLATIPKLTEEIFLHMEMLASNPR